MNKIFAYTLVDSGELFGFELTKELAGDIIDAYRELMGQGSIIGLVFDAAVHFGSSKQGQFNDHFDLLTRGRYLFLSEDLFESQNMDVAYENQCLKLDHDYLRPISVSGDCYDSRAVGMDMGVLEKVRAGTLKTRTLNGAFEDLVKVGLEGMVV